MPDTIMGIASKYVGMGSRDGSAHAKKKETWVGWLVTNITCNFFRVRNLMLVCLIFAT